MTVIDISHIHPMLVHFPIVLFFLAASLQALILSRGGDLAANRCLANTALAVILAAAVFAIPTAIFGDIALEGARGSELPRSPLELHELFGFATMSFLVAYAAVNLLAWWRGFTLVGSRGRMWFAIGLTGVVLVLITAYLGGELVYGLGVNVAAVNP